MKSRTSTAPRTLITMSARPGEAWTLTPVTSPLAGTVGERRGGHSEDRGGGEH